MNLRTAHQYRSRTVCATHIPTACPETVDMHFDHFLPAIKGDTRPHHVTKYKVETYWYNSLMVLELNIEKFSL
jgi:hypothetical protein